MTDARNGGGPETLGRSELEATPRPADRDGPPEPRRRLSARAEKAIRLTSASLIAAGFGIAAVITDSEALGFVGPAIILAAILAGPIVTRALRIGRG